MNKIPSKQIIDILIKAEDQASSTADKVKEKLTRFGDVSSKANELASRATQKMSSAIQSLGSRMNVFGGAGGKIWNNFKTRISSAASTLKGKFTGAMDTARAKLKQLKESAKGAGGGFGFLRNAASMAAGMIGYDLLNSIMETTKASLNARSSMQAFAKRLNMTSTEVDGFQKSLDDLQGTYKKIDMDVVGQQATDMAYRLGLPKQSLTELTETTAIFTDAMQRNGRSAEDSMLAMSDAMDGQFVRLKEIGIGQDDLMKNGWDGDINNKTDLLKAMNKALKDQHYDELAKSVDTLDDAWRVLSITLSNLVEKILVPLTPIIVTIVNGLTDFFDMIINNPTAQAVTLIGGLAIGFALLAGAIAITEGGITALVIGAMPGFIVTLYEAAAGFMAISVAGAPLWLIVAAVAAVAFAVYELGKSFGWWSDVGSMLDAISAGVQRLWSAFINNPNVKGFIRDIGNAWDSVTEALQPVIKWAQETWKELFPDNADGEVDVVRMIIDAFGQLGDFLGKVVNAAKGAWNTIASFASVVGTVLSPIGTLVDALRSVVCMLLGCSPGIVPALLKVQAMFGIVWAAIAGFVPGIIRGIVTTIINIIQKLPVKVLGFLKKISSHFLTQGSNWVKNAKAKASSVVTGAVSYIKNLPGKIGHHISSTANKISTGAQAWVNNAKSKASSVVTGVTSKISNLPGKVYTEFKQIGSRMLSAGSSLVENAKKVGSNIVKGLLDAMKIHSPGEIQEKVVAEFENTLSRVGNMTSNAYRTGSSVGSAIVDGFGDVNLGTDSDFNVYTGQTQTLEVHVTHDNNYTFEGLPDTVSAKDVASMINNAAEDDEWTKKLVQNPRFQKFDLKEKTRIRNRRNRSRGV